jgi:hypothetical protein
MTTANKNVSNGIVASVLKIITARPAAGPLTPCEESLMDPTTIPPIIPAIRPENRGAPLANAIPRQSGKATKSTTILAGISRLYVEKMEVFSFIVFYRINLFYK